MTEWLERISAIEDLEDAEFDPRLVADMEAAGPQATTRADPVFHADLQGIRQHRDQGLRQEQLPCVLDHRRLPAPSIAIIARPKSWSR